MRNLGWLAVLVLMGWAEASQGRTEVRVLCYHTFLGKPHIPTDFSLREFSAQLAELGGAGYRFVSLAQIKNAQVQGSKNLLVMFDDGHRTALHAYQQIMQPQKLPAVFAIYPGTLGHHGAMSWRELTGLSTMPGVEIVAHGYWHEKLDKRFAERHPREFVEEFERAKKTLETKLSLPITDFVYPFGVISARAKAQLRKSGYHYAYGLVQRPLLIPLSANPDPLALPRTMMTRPIARGIIQSLLASS